MNILSVTARKFRSLTTFSAFEIFMIPFVLLLLGLARLAIMGLAFRTYANRLGRQADMKGPTLDVSPAKTLRAKQIGRVVRRSAQVTPWESLCLGQAMVAALLLKCFKIQYRVAFGVASTNEDDTAPNPLMAHAWTQVGEVNITGGQDVSMYTPVMAFEHLIESKA